MGLNVQYCNNYKTLKNYDEVKQWMTNQYSKFNGLYFDNMLPQKDMIIFEPVIKKVSYAGCAYDNDVKFPSSEFPYKIRLNFIYDMPEIEWQNVLLHEMIHIWQYTCGYEGGHGKTFRMKAKEINSYGWGITTKYKDILNDIGYARDREKNITASD